MSFLDSWSDLGSALGTAWNTSMDATVGLVYKVSSPTGMISPWKLAEIEKKQREDIARAKGVGVGGKTVVASPAEVRRAQDASVKEINDYLKSQGQHPDQLGDVLGTNIKTLRSTLILIGSLALGAYFLVEIAKAYVSRRK